jgi:hypothetical protein
VAAGTVSLTSDTISSNTAKGGNGGNGGDGGSGGISRSNIDAGGNGGDGGSGGAGGYGYGGGLYVAAGTVTVTTDTISSNKAVAGAGGKGGQGGAGGRGNPTGRIGSAGTAGSTGLNDGGGLLIAAAASVSLDAFTVANTTGNTPDDIDGSYTIH